MPANDIAPGFDLSAGESALLERAEAIAASHAPVDGQSMSLAALRGVFRALEPTGYLGSVLPPEAGGKRLSPLAFAALSRGLLPTSPCSATTVCSATCIASVRPLNAGGSFPVCSSAKKA